MALAHASDVREVRQVLREARVAPCDAERVLARRDIVARNGGIRGRLSWGTESSGLVEDGDAGPRGSARSAGERLT